MPSRRSHQAATPAASRDPSALPAYQEAAAPLNTQGQHALRELQNQNTTTLSAHFKAVNEELAQSAYNVQESLANQQHWLQGLLKRTDGGNARYKSRLATVEVLADRTQEMSATLEQKMRNTIDAQGKLKIQQEILQEICGNLTGNNGRVIVAATQSTLGASQFRPRSDADADDEPSIVTENAGLTTLLKRKLDQYNERYAQLSLAERYAEHNDYIAFRRGLHDGKYAPYEAQQPLLPHANTWFNADGPVLSQEDTVEEPIQNEGQEDSDVEAVGETINTTCPLSLMIMTDPVRSRKCPHVFQRSAIEIVLQNSTSRVEGRGRNRAKTVKCPVCDEMLTEDDLVPDATLKKRIERLLATQARNEGMVDDHGDDFEHDGGAARRAQTVDSQSELDLDRLMQIKAERKSGVARQSVVPATQRGEERSQARAAASVPATQVVDLDMDDSDNEEEEEEED